MNLETTLPFKKTRPRRFRELLDVLGGYRAQTKKARLDAMVKIDEFNANLADRNDDLDVERDASILTLINHHSKRAFTEANIGSDADEDLLSNPWKPPLIMTAPQLSMTRRMF